MGFIGLVVLILGLIFILRNLFGKKEGLSEKYAEQPSTSLIKGRAKYPDVDVFEHSGTLFRFGLAAALCLTLLGFSWTNYEKVIDVSQYSLEVDDEIEIEPPRTAEPPPPPPPPPPPVIEEVPEEEIEEEEEPVFEDQSIEEETFVEQPPPPEPVEEAPPPPPPPPPPPADDVDEIFKVVEQMPMFGGCSDKACSDQELIKYLYKNLKYPAIARENGVEGRVYIQFVVERDGGVTDGRIVRDIGAGCGKEALRVVENMNNLATAWKPGNKRAAGQPDSLDG